MKELKEHRYKKKEKEELDQEFERASRYGKVKLGEHFIFWKRGLTWYQLALADVCRVYRRIEAVDTKMCCGNVNFDIQKLVMIQKDGSETEILIGEGTPKEAEGLYRELQEKAEGISFGKQ